MIPRDGGSVLPQLPEPCPTVPPSCPIIIPLNTLPLQVALDGLLIHGIAW